MTENKPFYFDYYWYPGCAMETTGKAYGLSIAYVAKKIGLNLHEISDWNCCGATSAHAVNRDLALALPARNIALAERDGRNMDIAVACAACYSRMRHSLVALRSSEEERARISENVGMDVRGRPEIVSFLDLFNRPEIKETVALKLVRHFESFPVACYYGCLTSRPSEIAKPDDPENPMTMDSIVAMTGAAPVDWGAKTMCCGASHQVDAPEEARPLIGRILKNAVENGAKAIITACPLCSMNLDMRRAQINKSLGTDYEIPVYTFTELLALCMGAHPFEAGLNRHYTPAEALVRKYIREGKR